MQGTSGLVGNVNLARCRSVSATHRMSSPLGVNRDLKVLVAYGGTISRPPPSGLFDSSSRVNGMAGYGRATTIHSDHMRSGADVQTAMGSPIELNEHSKAGLTTPHSPQARRSLGLSSTRSLAPRDNEILGCLSPSRGGIQDSVQCRSPRLSKTFSSRSVEEVLCSVVRDRSPPPSTSVPWIRKFQNTITQLDSSQSMNPDEKTQRSWLSVPLVREQSPRIRRQRSAIALNALAGEQDLEKLVELPRQVIRRYSSALSLPTDRSSIKAPLPSPRALSRSPHARSPSLRARSASPSVVKDHMWQTLSECEELGPLVPRLRDEGCVIGKRGKASPGISWRQLPQFSPAGKLRSTAEPSPVSEDIRVAIGMQSKKGTIFSGHKPEMIEVLTDGSEAARLTPSLCNGDGPTIADDICAFFSEENSSPFTKPSARPTRVRPLSPVSALQPGHMVPFASSPIDEYAFVDMPGKARNRQRVQDLQDEAIFQAQPRTLSPQKVKLSDASLPSPKVQQRASIASVSTASTEHPLISRVTSQCSERPRWR